MQDDDLKKIADLVTTVVDNRFQQFKGEVTEEFRHQMSIQREDFQQKLDLVVEGQQMLGEKVDRLEVRMVGMENRLERVEVKGVVVERKVEGIAADLTAHRQDTETHRKKWQVREE
jgi:DNA invertase Pin-like site-specific DNA recombinase